MQMAERKAVAEAYRALFRAFRVTFPQDLEALQGAKNEARRQFREHLHLQPSDPVFEEKLKLARETADFLVKNVVQARLVSPKAVPTDATPEPEPEAGPLYSYKFTSRHEMGDNAAGTEAESSTACGKGASKASVKVKRLGPCAVRCDDCSCGAPPS